VKYPDLQIGKKKHLPVGVSLFNKLQHNVAEEKMPFEIQINHITKTTGCACQVVL